MSVDSTQCPRCQSQYAYEDRGLWVCPECAHEWNKHAGTLIAEELSFDGSVRDVNGNILQDGDSVSVIKDLKVKGSSQVVKVGTKVRNIRLIDSDDDHNISCKIDGIGAMNLKSAFVKKV